MKIEMIFLRNDVLVPWEVNGGDAMFLRRND